MTFMMRQTNPPVSAVAPTRNVFVYGTLRAGGSNDITRYRPLPRRIGSAVVCGTLYDLGVYPGMRLGGSQPVIGEVYLVDAIVERQLDMLESVLDDDSGEYVKRIVEVDVDGLTLTCLVYEIQLSRVVGHTVIAHGDWLVHTNGKPKSHP